MLTFTANYLTGESRILRLKATDLDAAMQEADKCRGFRPCDETICLSVRAPWIAGVSDGMNFTVAVSDEAGGWLCKADKLALLSAIEAHLAPKAQVAA